MGKNKIGYKVTLAQMHSYLGWRRGSKGNKGLKKGVLSLDQEYLSY